MGQRSPHLHQRSEVSTNDTQLGEQEARTSLDLIKFEETPPIKDKSPRISRVIEKDHFVLSYPQPLISPSSFDTPPMITGAEISPVVHSFPTSNPLTSPSCSETEVLARSSHLHSSTVLSYCKETPEVGVSNCLTMGEPSNNHSSSPRLDVKFLATEHQNTDPLTDSHTHSMDNLLELSGRGEDKEETWVGALTSSPRTRLGKLKKLREKFAKKKPKSADICGSPNSPREPRSKSEHKSKNRVELTKPRSQSELSPQPEDRSESPTASPKSRKKRRSYTMLTSHITAKYQALHARTRRKSDEALPKRGDSMKMKKYESVKISVKKMSPEAFQTTLYNKQLKYKLRFALQSIHTPLTTSPVYLQLCADEDSMCDSRYQLITLLQHALQRSKWRHDAMEIALITEILRMVEPLPNWL